MYIVHPVTSRRNKLTSGLIFRTQPRTSGYYWNSKQELTVTPGTQTGTSGYYWNSNRNFRLLLELKQELPVTPGTQNRNFLLLLELKQELPVMARKTGISCNY